MKTTRTSLLTGILVLAGAITWGMNKAMADDPTYVGTETCAMCHADQVKAFEKMPHYKLEKNANLGWKGRSCESCHGPGSKHAESADPTLIRQPKKLDFKAATATCQQCHADHQPHQKVVTCVQCHSVHSEDYMHP